MLLNFKEEKENSNLRNEKVGKNIKNPNTAKFIQRNIIKKQSPL